MKISADILDTLNLEAPVNKEPINVMKCRDVLALMEKTSVRMISKSNLYIKEIDADIQLDCIDIITAKLNEFTQIFRDLIIFMREQEGSFDGISSLRYCISSYDSFEFGQTEAEAQFLRELLLRNEITHDYFNMEIHQQKLIGIMENYVNGSMDICEHLREYCANHELLDTLVSARR